MKKEEETIIEIVEIVKKTNKINHFDFLSFVALCILFLFRLLVARFGRHSIFDLPNENAMVNTSTHSNGNQSLFVDAIVSTLNS